MRILHVSPYFAPAFCYGGPPRSIFALCAAQLRHGVDLEVFTTGANGSKTLPSEVTGCRSYEGVPVRFFTPAFPRRFFGADGMAAALIGTMSSIDLVHVHGLWTAPAWLAAREARRQGRPYIVSPRGMLEPAAIAHHAWRKQLAFRTIERRNLTAASFVHATSNGEAATLERLELGTPILTIPNGVDTREPIAADAAAAFRRARNIAADAPVIVFLGRLHPIKRLDLLAEALHRVRAVLPEVRLVIAGPDEGGYRRRVESAFAGSDDAVHWFGAVTGDERSALLGSAQVLVSCSDSESFGLSVAEAMAAATPVVVTRTCPWEDVERFNCGRWTDQTGPAIAAGVLDVLSDPARARAMGRAGRGLVERKYTWRAVAASMIDHYRTILDETRS